MNGNLYPITVSYEGVLRLLSQLHPQKATGPDEIPSRFLKELACDLTPMLTLIIIIIIIIVALQH